MTPTRDTWRQHANCRGHDTSLFYPEDNTHADQLTEALNTCADCPVAQACLDDAFQTGDYHAIRGGLTGTERKRMKWRRQQQRRRDSDPVEHRHKSPLPPSRAAYVGGCRCDECRDQQNAYDETHPKGAA